MRQSFLVHMTPSCSHGHLCLFSFNACKTSTAFLRRSEPPSNSAIKTHSLPKICITHLISIKWSAPCRNCLNIVVLLTSGFGQYLDRNEDDWQQLIDITSHSAPFRVSQTGLTTIPRKKIRMKHCRMFLAHNSGDWGRLGRSGWPAWKYNACTLLSTKPQLIQIRSAVRTFGRRWWNSRRGIWRAEGVSNRGDIWDVVLNSRAIQVNRHWTMNLYRADVSFI